MAPPVHHRSTWLKQSNKSHKSTHRSKRAVNLASGGKIQGAASGRSRSGTITSGIAKLGKKGRQNHAQILRKKKKDALFNKRRMGGIGMLAANDGNLGTGGKYGAPRLIGIVALGEQADANSFARNLIGDQSATLVAGQPKTFMNAENKVRGSVIVAERTELAVLDVAKCADIICFILPVGNNMGYSGSGKRCALEQYLEASIDVKGRTFITLAKNQGLPTVIGVVQNLECVSKKHQTAVRRQAALFFENEFGPSTKLIDGGSSDETMLDDSMKRIKATNAKQILRTLMDIPLKNVTFRSERTYLLADSAEFKASDNDPSVGSLCVRGYLRGQPLSIHQLVHIPGHGTYQMRQIDSIPDPYALKKQHSKGKSKGIETTETLLVADPSKIPDLKEEATPDLLMGEQTWPTEEEMATELAHENNSTTDESKKGAKKVNEYQSAWNIGDESDEEEGFEDDELSDEKMKDSSLNEQLLKEWRERRLEERDEIMFPDEVEVPLDTPARDRFIKYRGLKSFRSSPWHPKESLPPEFAYIYQLKNVNALQKGVLEFGKEKEDAWLNSLSQTKGGNGPSSMDVEESPSTVSDKLVPGHPDCVCPGTFVAIYLQNVPSDLLEEIKKQKLPLIVTGLLEHEQKLTIVNCNVQRLSTYDKPVKSRELLTLHCGFWRRQVRPTFSENNLNCDKHKMDRFLQHGRWTVASVYAPVTFGTNIPAMFFDSDGELVAAGSLLDLNPDRIVLKKAVLTGYPFRNKKRNAVVRFMFHDPDDIKWFKPVELWTKYGLSGRITDSLGTHGLFKANFDRIVKNNDTICMSLYKRVFPKPVGEFASLRTQH